MTSHKTTNDLIPEYVSGLLTQHERAQVEAHLAECAECRELVETCQQLSVTLKDELQEELRHHPTTDELASFAISPETMSEHNRQRVGFHLEVCKVCADDLLAVKGLDDEVRYDEFPHAAGKTVVRSDSFVERMRRLFARPAVAFGTTLALLMILAIPVLKNQFGEESALSRSGGIRIREMTVALPEQTRSGLSRHEITITPGLETLFLELRFRPETDRAYTASLTTDEGRIITVTRLTHEQAQTGITTLTVAARDLGEGDYTAVVSGISRQGDTIRVFYPFTIKR